MNGCRKYEDLLARYLHGELLAQDLELLSGHLSSCPDCERLYRDVSDADRLLRDLPGKQVDPPAHLRARILANLQGERPATVWGRWGRWVAAAGAVAVCSMAAALVFRGIVREEVRVASAPPPVVSPAPPATTAPGTPAVVPESGTRTPSLKAAPGARRKQKGEMEAASEPGVQVIREVKVFFYYPPAHQVAVTGDFNGWNVDGVPMRAAGKPGLWETALRIPPGVYSYNFIVDGEYLLPDPNAPNQMPDGYGGTNSILLVQGENAI